MENKKLNLDKIEIEAKDLFKAHPIRFVLAALVFAIWLLNVLNMNIATFDIIGFIVSSCFWSFIMWLVYGPINLHRVKRHKEMEETANYILENQNNQVKNMDYLYCAHCGAKIQKEWLHCPTCGNKNE